MEIESQWPNELQAVGNLTLSGFELFQENGGRKSDLRCNDKESVPWFNGVHRQCINDGSNAGGGKLFFESLMRYVEANVGCYSRACEEMSNGATTVFS